MLKVFSLAALVLMVYGLVRLFMMGALFSPFPIAIAAQAGALALMVWARVTFGRRSFHAAANPTAGGLVVDGPYHFIRHPIYTSACIFCWAGVLTHLSSRSILLGSGVLVGSLVRMLCEERMVVARYPEYQAYAATTKRMVPYLF
jgi:protein-S-isoprenylcysteine O-methyltransferase Ste14